MPDRDAPARPSLAALFSNVDSGITSVRIPLSPTTRTSSMVQESRATRPYPHARDAPVIRSSRCGADHAAARPPIAPARAQSGDGVRVSDHFCVSARRACVRVRSSSRGRLRPDSAPLRVCNRPERATSPQPASGPTTSLESSLERGTRLQVLRGSPNRRLMA